LVRGNNEINDKKLERLKREKTISKVERMLADLPIQPRGTILDLIREDRDAH